MNTDMDSNATLKALCVTIGRDGNEIIKTTVGLGIEGDLDSNGEQVWYDTIKTIREFHPEWWVSIERLKRGLNWM